MTESELYDAISETERQEFLFRMAGDQIQTAFWIMERVRLRGELYQVLMSKIR